MQKIQNTDCVVKSHGPYFPVSLFRVFCIVAGSCYAAFHPVSFPMVQQEKRRGKCPAYGIADHDCMNVMVERNDEGYPEEPEAAYPH